MLFVYHTMDSLLCLMAMAVCECLCDLKIAYCRLASGPRAAEVIARHFPSTLNDLLNSERDPEQALTTAFFSVDDVLRGKHIEQEGTAALVCMFCDNNTCASTQQCRTHRHPPTVNSTLHMRVIPEQASSAQMARHWHSHKTTGHQCPPRGEE